MHIIQAVNETGKEEEEEEGEKGGLNKAPAEVPANMMN